MTDNHSYETPQKGATEWHESLNRNFRDIDRDVEIRDINAAKADYRPKSGAKFLATDTEDVYVGDGDQWLRLATSGENPLFDTVSAKTIVDRNSGNGYSVDQLAGGSGGGSVEPPVDAVVTLEGGTPTAYRTNGTEIAQNSDAAAVLNSAMTNVASEGGGVVYICSGTYASKSKVTIPSNITIQGAGPEGTVFQATSDYTGWASADNPARHITIRDLTVDGDGRGDRTGINLNHAIDSLIENVLVKNAGGRDESGGTTPSLRISRGLRSYIVNCHVRGSSSVSISAARATDCDIVNCTVKGGIREGGGGFLHGISIEKSESCSIRGCHVDSTNEDDFNSFRPALNANNADRCVVANNTVRGAAAGIYNQNGDCFNSVYYGNTLEAFDYSIRIGAGGAGVPHGTILGNNVCINGTVELSSVGEAVYGNLFDSAKLYIRSPPTAPSIVGNYFRGFSSSTAEIAFIEDTEDGSPILFANNGCEQRNRQVSNRPYFRIKARYGIMTGNSFALSFDQSDGKAIVGFENSDARWVVTNNYFRGAANDTEPVVKLQGGRVSNNMFEGEDPIQVQNSTTPPVIENNTYQKAKPSIKGGASDYTLGEARTGTYIGDGTTGRLIKTFNWPEHVIIEDENGTKYDAHAAFGAGFEYDAPSGKLSITEGGFIVGDINSDAKPNTNDETYTFYAR